MFQRFLQVIRRHRSVRRPPDDLVAVLLAPGEVNPPPERLEQLGLTVDARRVRESGYNPDPVRPSDG